MYHKLPEKPTVFFDVDLTLVFGESDLTYKQRFNKLSAMINDREFYVHEVHVEKIKEFKARGHNVVVWSAGGSDWAESVVNALKISKYVDLIVEKPRWYFDDLSVNEWIGKRYYTEFK